MKKQIIFFLFFMNIFSFAIFDKIKSEIKLKNEEVPRFLPIISNVNRKEIVSVVEKGEYEIILYDIDYPNDFSSKNDFYNNLDDFLTTNYPDKNNIDRLKYSFIISDLMYDDMKKIRRNEFFEEEKFIDIPASSLDEQEKSILQIMTPNLNLSNYLGTDQEFLNRQVFVLYNLLSKSGYDSTNVYSELEKEELIEKIKIKRKEIVDYFVNIPIELFIKKNFEQINLKKFEDDTIYPFDKDIVLSEEEEDQAIFPEIIENIYITNFDDELSEKLTQSKVKLKRRLLLIENNVTEGYMFNEENIIIFIGGKTQKYYYPEYKVNVIKKYVRIQDLGEQDSNYYISDFFR